MHGKKNSKESLFSIEQVAIVPINAKYVKTDHNFTTYSGVLGREIIVPRGFVFDGMSIKSPTGILSSIFGHHYSPRVVTASCVHDYLYDKNCLYEVSRKEADRIFLELLIRHRVPRWKAKLMYYAVRAFGGGIAGLWNHWRT